MSLDMNCVARTEFIDTFHDVILRPRGLCHRIQFTGPTGANSVEAAIKLARKATGRTNIVAFTNGFHGCSLGALSLTGSRHHRSTSSALLNQVTRLPYDGYLGSEINTIEMIGQLLDDPSSGIDLPAAFVVELVQGEGGLQAASKKWVQELAALANRHEILLIVDDIQAGCGRTGNFFSFEPFEIKPDIICLAKAISGFGLPMSLMLMHPDLDQWEPGEHNGTFRGNVCAFITATAAIKEFWQSDEFAVHLADVCSTLEDNLRLLAEQYDLTFKGRGAMVGLEFERSSDASDVQNTCVENGLIVEVCGPRDEVLKFLPPLTSTKEELNLSFEILGAALSSCLAEDHNPQNELRRTG